ncbi:MAG TPA: hypothetical protein VFP17_13540, partial [Solirubrobacterales bacterium]|nr:hypothetical protein [Solirubrobacterales bacterium]
HAFSPPPSRRRRRIVVVLSILIAAIGLFMVISGLTKGGGAGSRAALIGGGALLVVIGALVLAIALLVSRALNGIFGVALYRYALDGEAVGGFTPEELESAVKTKGGRGRTASPPGATPGTI